MNEAEESGLIVAPRPAPASHVPERPAPGQPPTGKPIARTPGLHRARTVLNAALPLVERLLPLLDGNFASAALNLVAPRPDSTTPRVDLGPIERSLAEMQIRQQKISSQLSAQSLPLDQLRDQLVPELQQQVEALKLTMEQASRNQEKLQAALDRFQQRFNRLAVAGILLLAACLLANLLWLFGLRLSLH